MLRSRKGRQAKDGCMDIALARLLSVGEAILTGPKIRLG